MTFQPNALRNRGKAPVCFCQKKPQTKLIADERKRISYDWRNYIESDI